MIRKLNLQLFAEPDEDELEDMELEEETEETEEDSEESETTEESEEQEEIKGEPVKETDKKKPDKVTAAVIKQKQENKKLRDELAQLRKEREEREQVDRDNKLRQKLIDDGFTEEDAAEKVADKREREQLKRELRDIKYGQQADKLASKYPDIYDHLDKFIKIVESSGGDITLAELCRAKLDERSEYETRTKTEQELLLTKKKASEKQIKTGTTKTDVIKFDAADEAAYKYYITKNPGKSRADYQQILKAKRGEI